MSFLYPSFLFALAVLAIPIVIHLFNFRRYKTVYFSNVSFLKDIKEETTSRSKLKHLLVLISRMLALAFLVFAFAQPYIPQKETNLTTGSRSVSVYVDNSFSMDAMGDRVSLLDMAKRKATEIAGAYEPEMQFQLITNDFEGRHQRLVSRDEFIQMVGEVEISPAVRKLEQVKERQLQAMQHVENKEIFMLSDFQKNATHLNIDTSAQYHLIPLKAVKPSNIAIDSIWMDAPVQLMNRDNHLLVRLANYSHEPVESSGLTLQINGQIKGIKDFSIPANSYIVDTIHYSITHSGWHKARVHINDYPMVFDDEYYLTFHVPGMVHILSIDNKQPLMSGFTGGNLISVTNNPASQVNYGELHRYNLIILNELNNISSGLGNELQQYVRNGGSLLIYPGKNIDLSSFNSFLAGLNADRYGAIITNEQSVHRINLDHKIFHDVFDEIPKNILLPQVKKYYPINRTTQSLSQSLLTLQDGRPFLSVSPFKNGMVYQSAVPVSSEFSDMQRHSLFVVSIIQIALNQNNQTPMQYTIGSNDPIEIRSMSRGSSQFRMKMGDHEFIPEQRPAGNNILLRVHDQIRSPGIYEIKNPDMETTHFTAFNFDRKESDISAYTLSELKDKFPYENVHILETTGVNISGMIANLSRGISLWKYCIIFALLFLAVEMLLLRWWSSGVSVKATRS